MRSSVIDKKPLTPTNLVYIMPMQGFQETPHTVSVACIVENKPCVSEG